MNRRWPKTTSLVGMALASVQSKQLHPKMSEHDLQSKIDELTQKLRSSDIYLLLKQTALQVQFSAIFRDLEKLIGIAIIGN